MTMTQAVLIIVGVVLMALGFWIIPAQFIWAFVGLFTWSVGIGMVAAAFSPLGVW